MLMFLSEDMTREDSAPDSLGVNMLKTHMEMDADLVDKLCIQTAQRVSSLTFPVLFPFSDFLSVRRTNLVLFELFTTEFFILAKLSDNKPLNSIVKADITSHLTTSYSWFTKYILRCTQMHF